jgi:hypothetical protein
MVLTSDVLDVIEQFTFDLALGAGTDAVDRLDQQVDQIVGQTASTQIDKRGQPGTPRRIGMPAPPPLTRRTGPRPRFPARLCP